MSLKSVAARALIPRWLVLLGIFGGVYVILPLVAPAFMHLGWDAPGRAIYFIYSWLCHQLPERSFFLYGPKLTYSLAEVQAAWQNTSNPLILRQFVGDPEMGWKVAWSDRMFSMFMSTWLFGLLWWALRRRIPRLPWWGFALFLLPMAVDGTTHFLSDLAGIGQGFRDSNTWLVILTQHTFPASFYAGDAWGSFNSIMRLLTGISFGIGTAWFGLPYMNEAFSPYLIFT